MRYHALVTDYDGTIASGGKVDAGTLSALERLKASGRKLVLVTGRELDDLLGIFPQLAIFDSVVTENGAVLYRPATKEERVLGERPPEEFIRELHERGVAPFSVGRVIVATWEPHANTVLNIIHDLGLELQVIFNKGAVMVLPSGINKATGMHEALWELGLSHHNAVGVGDAENDHAFLAMTECSVAVANALSMLKKRCDLVTRGDHGAGVAELIEHLLENDLAEFESKLTRHDILVGTREDGRAVRFSPYRESVLLAGDPASGKTTFATSFVERLVEQAYQFCVLDPEGDYVKFEGAVVLGNTHRSPSVDEAAGLIEKSSQNAVVSLLRVPLEERPRFFKDLFARMQELRGRTGRPHWLVMDEMHHLLPATEDAAEVMLPKVLHGMMIITVQPDHIAPGLLAGVDTIIATGERSGEIIRIFAEKLGRPVPTLPGHRLQVGEGVAWSPRRGEGPFWFRGVAPHGKRHRHFRKYAEGDLGPDRSFYFRGPDGRLNLCANNLFLFNHLADGVDDDTWTFHLRRSDFSKWIQSCIKDQGLAMEVAVLESCPLTPQESRGRVKKAIEARYTAPA